MKTFVVSLGGSIISPSGPDSSFLSSFKKEVSSYLSSNENRIIFVTGGGSVAREYQRAMREIEKDTSPSDLDTIGIAATYLNASLLKTVFSQYATDPIVTNPTEEIAFTNRVLVCAGWKPGFSTDTDAALLAKRFACKEIINLSNTERIYKEDPKKNPNAAALDRITWQEYKKISGTDWIPGKNVPFDPIAAAICEEEKISVICAHGRNIGNFISLLEGKPFTGTVLSS